MTSEPLHQHCSSLQGLVSAFPLELPLKPMGKRYGDDDFFFFFNFVSNEIFFSSRLWFGKRKLGHLIGGVLLEGWLFSLSLFHMGICQCFAFFDQTVSLPLKRKLEGVKKSVSEFLL